MSTALTKIPARLVDLAGELEQAKVTGLPESLESKADDDAVVKLAGSAQTVDASTGFTLPVAIPLVDCGVQGGTDAEPTPRTLLKITPIDDSNGHWSLLLESALFSAIMNSVVHLALNNPRDPVHPADPNQPSFGIGIEGNWYESTTGRVTSEFYTQLLGAINDGQLFVGRGQYRAFYLTQDKLTGSARILLELGKYLSGFSEFSVTMSVDKDHANDIALFRINGGTTLANSSIRMFSPIAGGIRLVGNDVAGDPVSSARNTTGIVISPNVSPQGIEYLTATPGNGYGFQACTYDPSTGTIYYKIRSRANSLTWSDNVTIGSDFTVTFAGSVAIGSNGTPIKKVLSVLAPLDFVGPAAQSSEDLTVTVTGAVVGDAVSVTPPASTPANTSFTGFVSATDTVKVRCNNYSSGAVDPTSGSYRVIVTKF